MKLNFDPDTNEWAISETVLKEHLEKAVINLENKRLCEKEKRKFYITALTIVLTCCIAAISLIFTTYGIFFAIFLFIGCFDIVTTYIKKEGIEKKETKKESI